MLVSLHWALVPCAQTGAPRLFPYLPLASKREFSATVSDFIGRISVLLEAVESGSLVKTLFE